MGLLTLLPPAPEAPDRGTSSGKEPGTVYDPDLARLSRAALAEAAEALRLQAGRAPGEGKTTRPSRAIYGLD